MWIRLLRRNAPEGLAGRVRQLIAEGSAATNPVIELEVLIGYRTQAEVRRVRGDLASLIRLDVRQSTWETALEIGFRLRRAGIAAQVPDLLIAATALEGGATVLHADSDFDEMVRRGIGLAVESHIDAF